MGQPKKGSTYFVSQEQLDEYRRGSIERRLQWLLLANKMRRLLPQKTVELQDAFRRGEI